MISKSGIDNFKVAILFGVEPKIISRMINSTLFIMTLKRYHTEGTGYTVRLPSRQYMRLFRTNFPSLRSQGVLCFIGGYAFYEVYLGYI